MSDNPYAFPSPDDGRSSDGYGMELRDWFAGQALAMLADPNVAGADKSLFWPNVANQAYLCADAMLAERAKKAGK